jgi:diguanylate cyclase (GGDEF)-like protein
MTASATAPTIRVLLTEDVAADAELEVRELRRAGLRFAHRVVDSEQSFTAALREFAPDVILSDFSMPGFDGMAALALARELAPDIPFVFVSGTIGEEYAIRALKNGATDYVLKTNLVRLPAAVERALAEARDRQRLARLSRIREFSSSMNSALVRVRERQALFDEVCRIAVAVGGFRGAHVGMLEAASGEVRWVARCGDAVSRIEMPVSARADLESGQGIIGRALRTAKPAIWNDVEHDPGVRNRAHFLEHGVGAVGSFPMLVEGRAIGAFSLHAGEPRFFDQDEIALIEELSANISFALELLDKQDRINYLALYDALTGLPNRTLFHDRLTQAIDTAQRSAQTLALVMYDLERFKAINDTFGQHLGDRVLQAVAKRLRELEGDLSRIVRLGSNLFAVMFTVANGAPEVARRLESTSQRLFGERLEIDGREISLAAKAGIAVYPDDGTDADALFRNAEAALKQAKSTGEHYLFYAPQINARVAEQVELEHRLRLAIERREIFMHFQPKYELATRRLVGLEALMRWKGPDGVLMSPARFVPVLEQTGLIFEAGQQILAAASAAYRDWRARGLRAPRIAVNVSAAQLRRRSFVEDVRAALGDAGGEGGGVDLEITESLLMTDVDQSIRKLRTLRDAGMRIALDDFGTGYSSLAYLSKLPIDTLKIDRSFVHGMTENPDDTSIVSTIISLAQALRFKVVAEGVETEQQAQLLRLLRCDQVQGYLFSPPVHAERIESLLAAQPVQL